MGKRFSFDVRIEDSFEQENGAINIPNGVFDTPLAVLSKPAICVFWYLATKRMGDRFCVSKHDFIEKFPATSERQYYGAMQELIDVGYMKRDESTGFYSFNPNAEIEIKPAKKKKAFRDDSYPCGYPDIFIGLNDEATEPMQEIQSDKWYILPVNSKSRGDARTVYFCKCLGGKLESCIRILLSSFGHKVYDYNRLPFPKNRGCAYTTILNRALPIEKVGEEKVVQKLPNCLYVTIEDKTDNEGIPWAGAEITNHPELCKVFEKNGVHNLGAIVMEQQEHRSSLLL